MPIRGATHATGSRSARRRRNAHRWRSFSRCARRWRGAARYAWVAGGGFGSRPISEQGASAAAAAGHGQRRRAPCARSAWEFFRVFRGCTASPSIRWPSRSRRRADRPGSPRAGAAVMAGRCSDAAHRPPGAPGLTGSAGSGANHQASAAAAMQEVLLSVNRQGAGVRRSAFRLPRALPGQWWCRERAARRLTAIVRLLAGTSSIIARAEATWTSHIGEAVRSAETEPTSAGGPGALSARRRARAADHHLRACERDEAGFTRSAATGIVRGSRSSSRPQATTMDAARAEIRSPRCPAPATCVRHPHRGGRPAAACSPKAPTKREWTNNCTPRGRARPPGDMSMSEHPAALAGCSLSLNAHVQPWVERLVAEADEAARAGAVARRTARASSMPASRRLAASRQGCWSARDLPRRVGSVVLEDRRRTAGRAG